MPTLLRGLLAAASLFGLLVFGACSSATDLDSTDPATGTTNVRVEDNRFGPTVIEVTAGTEVTWEFVGSRPHDVSGAGWGSDVQDSGMYTFQFDQPGTYDYTCSLHGNMDGRIIVTAS